MRIADLTEGTIYQVRRSYVGPQPAMTLDASQWHRREPQTYNTERPWQLFMRNDGPSIGWHEPLSGPKRGVPMISWTRAPFYGRFGDAERRALQIAAASVRLRFSCARIALDAHQIREVILGVVDEDMARFLSVDLVSPRRIEALPEPPRAPEPTDGTVVPIGDGPGRTDR